MGITRKIVDLIESRYSLESMVFARVLICVISDQILAGQRYLLCLICCTLLSHCTAMLQDLHKWRSHHYDLGMKAGTVDIRIWEYYFLKDTISGSKIQYFIVKNICSDIFLSVKIHKSIYLFINVIILILLLYYILNRLVSFYSFINNFDKFVIMSFISWHILTYRWFIIFIYMTCTLISIIFDNFFTCYLYVSVFIFGEAAPRNAHLLER